MTEKDGSPSISELLVQIADLNSEIDDLNDDVEGLKGELEEAKEPVKELSAALVMLHEEAHGKNSIKTCPHDPCRSVTVDWVGPAPVTMIAGV